MKVSLSGTLEQVQRIQIPSPKEERSEIERERGGGRGGEKSGGELGQPLEYGCKLTRGSLLSLSLSYFFLLLLSLSPSFLYVPLSHLFLPSHEQVFILISLSCTSLHTHLFSPLEPSSASATAAIERAQQPSHQAPFPSTFIALSLSLSLFSLPSCLCLFRIKSQYRSNRCPVSVHSKVYDEQDHDVDHHPQEIFFDSEKFRPTQLPTSIGSKNLSSHSLLLLILFCSFGSLLQKKNTCG